MTNHDQNARNRQLVLEGRDVLERTSQSLSRSNQIALETEQIGTETISELGAQRETLLRSQRRLETTNDGLSKSRQILRSMQKNVFYNKLVLILIILLELVILGGLIFIKFIHKH